MKSRMSKYTDQENNLSSIKSRINKNQPIYKEEYDDTLFPKNSNYNVMEIDKNVDFNLLKREEYKKNKEINKIFDSEIKITSDKQPEESREEPKIYDINTIIEKAKRDRKGEDALENKRCLKNDDYNIFAENSIDELKERKNILDKQKNDIEDLINTISNSDATTETGGLLDDLLESTSNKNATELNEYASKTILERDINEKTTNKDNQENTFFTKSVDLTDKDFDINNEEDSDFLVKKAKHPILKILLFVVLIAVVCVSIYFIYKNK